MGGDTRKKNRLPPKVGQYNYCKIANTSSTTTTHCNTHTRRHAFNSVAMFVENNNSTAFYLLLFRRVIDLKNGEFQAAKVHFN